MINILITYVFAGLLGVCIGSFINCVVYRLETGKNFLKGRSFCPACKHSLGWKDLFPVFSWIFLQGKCRYCREKISAHYPIVELATGAIFLSIINFQLSIFNEFSIFQYLNLIFWFYIASSLIIIFIYDLKHYLIPDKVLFPAIIIAFIYRILEFNNWYLIRNLKLEIKNFSADYLFAVLVASGLFFILWFFSGGRGMGFGDVKLAILLGLLLGFPKILAGLFVAFFSGAVVGIIFLIAGKKKMKSEIPFGPFLVFGTFVALFWGEQIINWYFSFI